MIPFEPSLESELYFLITSQKYLVSVHLQSVLTDTSLKSVWKTEAQKGIDVPTYTKLHRSIAPGSLHSQARPPTAFRHRPSCWPASPSRYLPVPGPFHPPPPLPESRRKQLCRSSFLTSRPQKRNNKKYMIFVPSQTLGTNFLCGQLC